MPGQLIQQKQVQLYLKARRNGYTQETAAAKGGFSVRTGRRIEKGAARTAAFQLEATSSWNAAVNISPKEVNREIGELALIP